MANPFDIERAVVDDVTVLKLSGFLDAHTAPEFEDAMQQEVDSQHHKIVVDCSELTYISSAGLGVFMGFVEDLRDKGGDIKICSPVPKVKQVFELLGFHQLYHIEDSQADALQRFRESPVWGG